MRRIISVFLTLMIIITSITASFGNKSLNKILLVEDGRGRNFEVLNLKIDGDIIESEDVPPVMYVLNNQGRTLIPLRMIVEHAEDVLNADIEWDQEKYEVKVTTEDKEITLKIDSPIAIVNGEEKRLPDDVPAKLLTLDLNGEKISRTMVPVRFFAEELGFDVDWDNDTRTAVLESPEEVEEIPDPEDKPEEKPGDKEDLEDIAKISDVNIEMNGATPQIRIKTSQKVDYKEFKLVNPERLVIDLNNAEFDYKDRDELESNGTLNINTDDVNILEGLRLSQFQNDPYVTRIVMELDNLTEHEVSYDEKNSEIVIDFNSYIRNIRKENMNAKEVIIIEGDSVSNYEVMELTDPQRLVVDIKDVALGKSISTSKINVDGKVANAIRISQKSSEDEESVRIVVDIKEDSGYEEAYIEEKDNKLYLHLEGEPLKTIKYEELGWTTSRLIFKGSTVTRYSLSRQEGTNTMEITVPKEDIELELASLNVNDHIIKTMDITENRDKYNIKLELQDSVEYELMSPEESKDFILEMNNKEAKYREKLIVIDAGHGGRDPGNISSTLNAHESVLVLDISLRYNKLLTDAGFRTYMTRVDNLNPSIKLSLQERVDVANALNPDLFISVHANSFTTPTPNGIENFYYPGDMESKKVAQIFQNEMIKDLNAIDRGAKPQNYFVLRNTNMPSILTETGFLSNPSEGEKLVNPEYRQQIAESMFRATIKYFEQSK